MKDQFKKYLWIVHQLLRTGGITFKELANKWEYCTINDLHSRLPKRTFDDYKKAIEEAFGIDIICDASRGYAYKIANKENLENENVIRWLINSFAVNSVLQESRQLQDRIIFEQIPSGNDFLLDILESMKDNKVISMAYQDFYENEPHEFLLEPYLVRVFKQRWYVIGKTHGDDRLNRYSLDRIIRLESTDEHFNFPAHFSADKYFSTAYGIIVEPDEYDAEHIRIKVYDINHKREYFRSLPLHESQKEIITEQDYSIFEYHLMPSYDFIQELLSHGEEIEVLSPDYVRAQMKKHIAEMYGLYNHE